MKDFQDFEKLALTDEMTRQRNSIAEAGLKSYLNSEGSFPYEDMLNAAYSLTMESTIQLLRQYHEWLNE